MATQTLTVGDSAPSFTAMDDTGTKHILKDYSDKWLLLYFYPKDFTSGCTTEACAFRDHYAELKKVAHIVGVSGDSSESHAKFREKHDLPFPLLADPDREIIKAYGANGILFPKRVSFLIDTQGVIRKIYKSVKPAAHAEQVLRDIQQIDG